MHSISISDIRLNVFSAELTSNNALTKMKTVAAKYDEEILILLLHV